MANVALKKWDVESFLAWEEKQPERYELQDGFPRMMAGGTEGHDELRGAIYASLRRQLDDKPCRPHIDLKLICPSGNMRYPDVAVVCSPLQRDSTQLREPKVVIEVLSGSTQVTDYMIKPIDYASVPSVDTYVIFDPVEPRAVVLRRVDDKLHLDAQIDELDGKVSLPSIDATLELAEVYRQLVGPA